MCHTLSQVNGGDLVLFSAQVLMTVTQEVIPHLLALGDAAAVTSVGESTSSVCASSFSTLVVTANGTSLAFAIWNCDPRNGVLHSLYSSQCAFGCVFPFDIRISRPDTSVMAFHGPAT